MSFTEEIYELNERAQQLYQKGQYQSAITLAKQACDLGRQHLGEDDLDLAGCLNNLAVFYRKNGEYKVAIPVVREALAIYRKTLGEDHSYFATTLSGLGTLHYSMGNYAEAKSLFSQVVEKIRQALGEENLDLAMALDSLGASFYAMGHYAEAEPFYRQALEIKRTVVGENHPYFAVSLNNLAVLYQEIGNYAAAEPLFRQAVEVQRTTRGKTHPEFAASLSNLAWLYEAIGNYAEAERLYQRAVEIERIALGESHPSFATSLSRLAGLYKAMGNMAAAERLYLQALEIKRLTLEKSHPSFAISLNNLAGLYQSIGNYRDAEPLYQEALEIKRLTLGKSHPSFAVSLNSLAGLYQSIGNYRDAEPLYQEALSIKRTILGSEHPSFATSLNNLALLYKLMGKYAAALPLYQQALLIKRQVFGQEHESFASTLNNLAELYRATGNYTAAERLYQQALAVRHKTLGESHPDFAQSLNNLGLLYQVRGNYEEALPFLRPAMEIRHQALGGKHPDFVASLINLGALYRILGNYTEAEALLQQALSIGQTLGDDHPVFAASLINLAAFYEAKGNYTAAEDFFQQAIDRFRLGLGDDHPNVVLSQSHLAALYVSTGRVDEALPMVEQVATAYDKMIGQIFSVGSESQRMAYLSTVQAEFEAFLSLVHQYLSDTVTAVQAGFSLVLRRKAIGAQALAEQRDAVLGGRYPSLQSKLREWTMLRQQIAQKTLAGPGKEGLDAHQQLLAEWNVQKERLEAELARQIPEMNLEQKLRAADCQTVAEALPKGGVLVEFVRFDLFNFKAVPARDESRWLPARYLAFILSAGEPDKVQMLDLGEADVIDQMIATFRAFITRTSDNPRHGRPFSPEQETSTSDGTALRAALFDPLLAALGGCTRLFLAPDGDLNRLPFEVLPTDNGRLIDDYQVSYLGVGRDVLRFGNLSSIHSTAPLVVADPDFDLSSNAPVAIKSGRQSRDLDRSALHFPPLPGTRAEGEQIATMLNVEPKCSQFALESALKACRSPRLLHLATHGFFLPDQEHDPNQEPLGTRGAGLGRLSGAGLENPLLRSGLALAGANTWLKGKPLPAEAEDGILTAEDVSGLDLLATELVVLSACETGLGEVQVGEGVFGLRRAFMLAGAKTLVMSLWKVPDKQTQELMSDFYRRILAGEPRAEALRQAQLAMKKKYPEPYYWGAFICQGDPSPLSQS